MKKALIGGLAVFLMAGLFMGCPEKPEEEKDDGPEIVPAEYRGTFQGKSNPNQYIEITKNRYKDNSSSAYNYAITKVENDELYLIFPAEHYPSNYNGAKETGEVKAGRFSNNKDTFYVKLPFYSQEFEYNRVTD